MIRVLVTLSPRIYREAVAFSLESRPDIGVMAGVMAAPPEEAELELAGFRPHLLVHNDVSREVLSMVSFLSAHLRVLPAR